MMWYEFLVSVGFVCLYVNQGVIRIKGFKDYHVLILLKQMQVFM
jgi:hypothetical protein